MKKTTKTLNALVATLFCLVPGLSMAQEQAQPAGDNSGMGLLLLIGVAMMLMSDRRRGNELVRCPSCKYQSKRREYVAGRCPQCGSQEHP